MTRRSHPPARPISGCSLTRRLAAGLVALVLVVLASTGCAPSSSGDASGPTVVRVVDGDTVVLRADGTQQSVRLIGIDTPETKHPTKPIQCFGPEASAFTTSVLPPGTAVRLERDVEERDHYGRLLVYLYRADDDVFVNLELARQGFAEPLSIAPNVAHAATFASAAAEARQAGRGLWSACRGGDVSAP